jgi:hypothetical protein
VRYFRLDWDSTHDHLQINYHWRDEPILYDVTVCRSESPARTGDPEYACGIAEKSSVFQGGEMAFDIGKGTHQYWLAVYCVSNTTCHIELEWGESQFLTGLSLGAIIAIVVVIIVLVMAIVACIVVLRKRRDDKDGFISA